MTCQGEQKMIGIYDYTVILTYILPAVFLATGFMFLLKIKIPKIDITKINPFIKWNKLDMSKYKPEEYKSFNDFF